MIIHNPATNPIGNYRSVCARFGKQRNVRVFVTKMKVCGKKYLVHDHRRLRSRFRLMAPGLIVNVSRAQIFELKSQNRKFNSLLCEIFTYLIVKIQKLRIQRVFI